MAASSVLPRVIFSERPLSLCLLSRSGLCLGKNGKQLADHKILGSHTRVRDVCEPGYPGLLVSFGSRFFGILCVFGSWHPKDQTTSNARPKVLSGSRDLRETTEVAVSLGPVSRVSIPGSLGIYLNFIIGSSHPVVLDIGRVSAPYVVEGPNSRGYTVYLSAGASLL
nr:hypothetical protein Iba_chr10eCG1050 [Ipomoea batatas]